MTENLILFTITPVQKFITTARKTEDLWLGSYILSHLNATAIHQIYAKDGINVIYPSIGDVSPFESWQNTDIRLPSFPNLFLSMSENLSVDDLTQTMRYVEEAVQCEFEKMARHAAEIFADAVDNRTWNHTYADQLFRKQIKHFLNFIGWFQVDPLRIIRIGTRKPAHGSHLLRTVVLFIRLTKVDENARSAGDREIFHNGKGEPMIWWQRFAQRRAKYCRQGEALCTVCLTKRLAGQYFGEKYPEIKQLSFPSTSEVSTADFKLTSQTTTRTGSLLKQLTHFRIPMAIHLKCL